MKIAQIVCVYPPYAGGIGTGAQNFYRLLKKEHEVKNFVPKSKHQKDQDDVIYLKPLLKYGHGAVLISLLWKLRKYDLVILHYPFFGSAEIVWLYKLLGGKAKLLIHYHMDVKNISLLAKILSWPNRLIRSSLFKQADIITAASLDYVAHSQIAKDYKKQEKKFIELPFALDINRFKPQDNKILNTTKTILFVGGLDKAHYFKGVEILLEALAKINFSNWQLKIIGSGELKEKYQLLAEKLKIGDKISFLGKLTDEELINNYQTADLLVLPSINSNEAFGLVLIEAMACGVPVIASSLYGVRSVFNNGQEGLLVEPGDAKELAQKIALIIKDEQLHKAMSLAARKLVLEKYDEKVAQNKLLEIVKNI